jgi:cobalamin biosynthesis protein CobT
MGYDEESANDVSFIGDLRNVIILMRSHGVSAKTAASLLRQTPELPFEFDSPEEEQEEDDDQENKENENETETNSSSSSSSCDESKEAKQARLDPDYCPSIASTSSSTTAGPVRQLPSRRTRMIRTSLTQRPPKAGIQVGLPVPKFTARPKTTKL